LAESVLQYGTQSRKEEIFSVQVIAFSVKNTLSLALQAALTAHFHDTFLMPPAYDSAVTISKVETFSAIS